MNLKKVKIISVVGIFMLCFLFHFGYDFLPNSITALFFPVNESIWEHMKMLYTAIIVYGIIDFFIMKKFKITFNNFFTNLFITSYSSILIFLIIYMPLYYKMGPKMILNFGVLFIVIIISQIISFYILKRNSIKLLNTVSIILIIIGYIVFGIFTYHPPKNEMFFDAMEEKYGLNTYRLILPMPNH